jgi:mannan endo-1,4-beta-mannosidase
VATPELAVVMALSAGGAFGCALKTTKQASAASPHVEYMKTADSYERIQVTPTDEPSPYFVKNGKPFCFMGTNNYYLIYMPKAATVDVLDIAARMNLKMVRTWAYLDRGSLDGTMPNIREPGHKEGIYFQYWDPAKQAPAYNDGADGLERLDHVIYEARKRDLTLTLVLTNNWRDFGGMDQYLRWYGLEKHHEFYTDPRVKAAYKNWVHHVLTRVNSIDGVPYKDDPAIFAWELANEPRTMNYENYDSPTGWDMSTLTSWANEMSAFIKSIDPNHMVAVGDEGFLNGGKNDWFYEGQMGVDNQALASLPSIDFGTYHLYPDHWGKGYRWGNDWIEDHIQLGRRVNKPMVLEEYGLHVRRQEETSGSIVHGWERREVAYIDWNNLVLERGGQTSMFWILSGIEKPGKLYPDYDHFTVYDGDETYQLLKGYAERFPTAARACVLAEGADHGQLTPFITARPAPKKSSAAVAQTSAAGLPALAGSKAETFLADVNDRSDTAY